MKQQRKQRRVAFFAVSAASAQQPVRIFAQRANSKARKPTSQTTDDTDLTDITGSNWIGAYP
jgi:hypothetical protein